jgi:MFS family permease
VYLLADNEEINQWLDENPAVLGGILLVIGLTILTFGIVALATGRSRSKYGRKIEGPAAYAHGAALCAVGGVVIAFALFKLLSGLS